MLRSINHGVPSSAPLNTRSELSCIFSHICNVLNSRPLTLQDDKKLDLNANLLCKPFLSGHDQELLMSRFLEEVFNEQDQKELFSKIFKGNNDMAQSAHIMLKREFLNTRKMFTDKKNGPEPLKGDVVIICKDDPRLGLITEVISKHRVKVKFKNRGKNKEDIYHPKTLGLIFRPATSTHFMAITNKDHNQLTPLLSSLWDKLGSCLKHTNIEPPTALLSPSSSS